MSIMAVAVSRFHGASLAVIGPELSADLHMSPVALGAAAGAFFLAIGLAQVPAGILLDRIGARLTISACLLLGCVGAICQGLATSGAELLAARFLLGLGCAANVVGAVTLCSTWYSQDRLSTTLSRVYATGLCGLFVAAAPLAMCSAAVGWRGSLFFSALLTGGTAWMVYLLVRDAPADPRPPMRVRQSATNVFAGLVEVWRTPGLAPVLAMNAVANASAASVLGLWAGPYLAEVHGLHPESRGLILLAMAVAMMLGTFAFGPLDRVFNSRKWVIGAGSLGTIVLLLTLAMIPHPPLALAAGLLILLCAITAYGPIIMVHGRGLFPDHLAGRGVTTINMSQVIGLAGIPVITGMVVERFQGGDAASPEIGYRVAFATLAGIVLLGLLLYLRSNDVKPGHYAARASPPRPAESLAR